MGSLEQMVESFLKKQAVVKKLQGNVLKISKQVVPHERFKNTVSKIDPEIVKHFTQSLEKSVGMTKRQIFMKECQDSAESSLKELTDSCKLYPGDPLYDLLCKKFWKDQRKTMDRWSHHKDNVKSGALESVIIHEQILRNIL